MEDVGYRSLCVSTSDIAAMGGSPRYALVSLGLPGSLPLVQLEDFWRGLLAVASEHGVRIVGGNLARHERFFADVSMLGQIICQPIRLSGARPGDVLLVTGTLGGARLGWECLQRDDPPSGAQQFVERFRRPPVRLQEAAQLAESGLISAMTDVSDGLAVDLRRLCCASNVGAVLRSSALPVAEGFAAVASALGLNPESVPFEGGEDYELLLTALPKHADRLTHLLSDASGPLTVIGEIVDTGRGILVESPDGKSERLEASGYQHFPPV
jgi:thiamine-monophosphate kinase